MIMVIMMKKENKILKFKGLCKLIFKALKKRRQIMILDDDIKKGVIM